MRNSDVIVVIQCTAHKDPNAGTFKSPDGREVIFVAHPETAKKDGKYFYAHPDGDCGDGRSWRQKLCHYNEKQKNRNPINLKSAGQLYRSDKTEIYSEFFETREPDKYFLLSPGWGLVRSDYLIPKYDITFSNDPPMVSDEIGLREIKRNLNQDFFKNVSMLPKETQDCIVFFGSIHYQELFIRLTKKIKSWRIVFFCATPRTRIPETGYKNTKYPGCIKVPFRTVRKRTWMYECAERFNKNRLELPKCCKNPFSE